MPDGKDTRERPLLVERDGAVETLVINDAPRNRMSLEFMDALEAEVARLANDSRVRAVVIRGAGEENFSVEWISSNSLRELREREAPRPCSINASMS